MKRTADTPQSPAQRDYILTHKRRHRFIRRMRAALLLAFLLLWEYCADKNLIDSFFFSSPSRVAACFLEMMRDRSLFLHIGVTLLETAASFLLVTVLSLLAATLLWYFGKLSEILEPYLVVLNSLPKSALAPLHHLLIEVADLQGQGVAPEDVQILIGHRCAVGVLKFT